MQTFLPMIDYRAACDTLDDARLNKQILEVSQIVTAITDPSAGYQNHPAVDMWRENVLALLSYGIAAAGSWKARHGNNRAPDLYSRQVAVAKQLGPRASAKAHQKPAWIGDIDFHESHRSNLIRKVPERYGPMWPGTPDNMPYLWPKFEGSGYRLFLSAADMKRLKTGDRVIPDYLRVLPDGEVVDAEKED